MIIAALHFWNPSTCSLHLKCGMLTPTLLDVAGLIGLKPVGQTFDPDNHVSELSFDFTRPAYGNFILDHHVTSSSEVSNILSHLLVFHVYILFKILINSQKIHNSRYTIA